MFETYLEIPKDKLNTEQLNLDGTHSLVKKSAQNVAYQYRKRGRTSNILIMTDGNGILIAHGGILKENHNDLFEIVPQHAQMIKHLNQNNIYVENTFKMLIKILIVKSLEELYNEENDSKYCRKQTE